MKRVPVLGASLLAACWVTFSAIGVLPGALTLALAQPTPPKPPTAPSAAKPLPAKPAAAAKSAMPAAAPGTAYRQGGFSPGFDDLMTMLIQPRHTKLYYAGAAKNWELAAAESRDLRQSMDRIREALPTYENNDVAVAISSFITTKLDAVDAAAAAADPVRFAAAYKDLTQGCNDCHTYMEHPFLVIKQPEPNGYPDQEFKAEGN
jgi:hypothetical protein